MFFLIRLVFIILLLSQVTFAQVENDLVFENSRAGDSLSLVHLAHETKCDLWKIQWDFNEPINEWYGIELNSFGRVFCIDLDGVDDCRSTKNGGNHLHGKLPELQFPYLEHLFLSSNKITGTLPSFKGVPNLLTLQLSGNRFEGEIPNFSNLDKLLKLDLEYNQLTGRIPTLDLPLLETLYLGFNQLYGYLPSFENLPNLKHIYINNNKLSGGLPSFIHMVDLEHFIFDNNFFEGPLPEYFKLYQLAVLDGHQNRLEGCYNAFNYKGFLLMDMNDNSLGSCDLNDLDVPTAFSPNGDGVNDFFEIGQIDKVGDVSLELMVWNQEGRVVYSNDNYLGEWDGTHLENGKHLPEGLYMIWLKQGDYSYKGTVFIKY